ncbi:MAG TPA: hypothetical protein VN763_07480 [Saprospiraceae bacterium]|nr:hypothetical protein [Saprospiraceae bacterium]
MTDEEHIEYLKQRIHDLQRGMSGGQNTGRTLIDCLNRYLTLCPISCELSASIINHKHSLKLSRDGVVLHEVKDGSNLQACYEELLGELLEKAFQV